MENPVSSSHDGIIVDTLSSIRFVCGFSSFKFSMYRKMYVELVNGYKSSFLCNTIDEIHLARGFTFERNAAQRFITSSYLQTFPKTLQPATCNFSDSLTVKSSSFVSGKWMDLGAERHSYFVQQRETTGRVYDIAVSFDSCGCDPAIFVSERRWFLFAANPR